ncbi:MAG: hypothetical protein QOF55_1616, partial [Thermoleophilaceae bacterium]|nr:hypothetical protein [Thermoleophilaceae bacterium]
QPGDLAEMLRAECRRAAHELRARLA